MITHLSCVLLGAALLYAVQRWRAHVRLQSARLQLRRDIDELATRKRDGGGR